MPKRKLVKMRECDIGETILIPPDALSTAYTRGVVSRKFLSHIFEHNGDLLERVARGIDVTSRRTGKVRTMYVGLNTRVYR